MSDAIPQIIGHLKGQDLRAPIAADPETVGGALQFLVRNDASGASWLYLYSDEQAMVDAGLSGQISVAMPFEEFFEIARTNGFGGIIIDAKESDSLALIPADYFKEAASVLLS